MAQIIAEVSRTFNEFLLLPNRTRPDCSAATVDLRTPLVRHTVGETSAIELRSPFTSAIMQAVSTPALAIALARNGGLSFLHHNQPIQDQVAAVRQVKNTTLSEADARLWDERLDRLPVPDAEDHLEHPVFRSGSTDNKRFPNPLVDAAQRLRVGAGINTHDYQERVPALLAAGADALCFDSSDGYGDWQAQALTWVKKHYPEIPVGGGNVVDGEAFTFLAEAGADFVKVGVGGGSICITRDQKGIGRGQASAVLDVAAARDAFRERTGEYVPICSDGGLVHDYHVALALAMGADFVMMGRYFARFDQAAGAKLPTRDGFVKEYWGEGSNRARNWQRYGQGGRELVFEEGVDGYVPYAGDLDEGLALTTTKLRTTMVSCGSTTLPEFRSTARLTLVSEQSFQESHASVTLRDTPTPVR
ncbi:IMP dehydrogenase [Streptomyces sp. RY43-2]|uniref:IMP dehydrogenase n=1 Tax=Streptomyces macrolidinus TaxID=2952607 RepID=A0ABT0ZFL0_9ACTN|nr:IMP dehydrogenase [Streptomyces macrolidinus]MCN9242355.1 IMP dehydrogenase [Streptomyces macrolidinus]